MSTTDSRSATKSSTISPRHGRDITPESRAVNLYEAGRLDFGQVNELEGVK
ncbi:chitin-binding protein, partial [Burkholderia pseudomallei]